MSQSPHDSHQSDTVPNSSNDQTPAYGDTAPASQPSVPEAPAAPEAQPSTNPWTPQSDTAGAQPQLGQPSAPQPGYGQSYSYDQGFSQNVYGTDPGYADQNFSDPYGQQYGAAPQPYQQVAPYQQGFAGPAPDHPDSTTVLVLGIVSIVVCGLTGPFAWIKGNKARADINANPGMYGPSTSLTVGWVLGIIGSIGLILSALMMVFYFFMIMLGIASSY